MKDAAVLLQEFLQKNNLVVIPYISDAERTDKGKVILSAGVQVSYKEQPEEPKVETKK